MILELPAGLILAGQIAHTFIAGICSILGLYLFIAGWRDSLYTKRNPGLPPKAQSVLVLTGTLGIFTAWFCVVSIMWTWG